MFNREATQDERRCQDVKVSVVHLHHHRRDFTSGDFETMMMMIPSHISIMVMESHPTPERL